MTNTTKITITLALFLIAGVWGYVWISHTPPIITQTKTAISATIDYPTEYNFRQTINDCGPFTVAAVVRAVTQQPVDSQDFVKTMHWRLRNKYTLPWGLEQQLKDHSISIELPHVERLSDADKITFLQEQLSQKKPIILLGERDGYEHYITLLGFDTTQDVFYSYDSLFDKGEAGLTIDANNELPGNRSFSAEEILTFWRGGGMYGMYRWYAIVANN